VVVRMFNESVEGADVRTWLCRYCNVLRAPARVEDADGIWNGSWRVLVELHPKPGGYGGLRHIPSDIALGANRGFVHYQGQPKLCRRCGELGHLAVACDKVACHICKELGHVASECSIRRACNLCGSQDHFFRECP
ncbi:ZCHC3 protein, partial [Polyodon spathula]|nr:ZCHC3 protein [Polyodon spathula]